MAPTVGQVAAACDGEVIAGDAELLGPRGAAPDRGGDDAAEPDGADRGRRGADHARRPRRRGAGGAVRARLVGAALARRRSCSPAGCGRPRRILRPLEGFPTMLPIVLTRHETYETATLAGAREGVIAPRHAAQDHQGAGGVRGPRRRRRAARPLRRGPLGGGHAADVRVHAARPRARRRAAHRAAGGHRRAGAAGGRDPAAPARGRARRCSAPRTRCAARRRRLGRRPVRRARARPRRPGAARALRRRVRRAARAQGR